MSGLLHQLSWLYVKLNRPFLAALSEVFIGEGRGDLKPHGRAIVRRTEEFLHDVPAPFFQQVALALRLFPIALPPESPGRSNVGRMLLRVWFILKSNITRIGFLMMTRKGREERIAKVHTRLIEMADEEDIFQAITVFSGIKSLLTSSYMELSTTWKGIGYSAWPNPLTSAGTPLNPELPPTPHRHLPYDPPSGPHKGRKPERTEMSATLLEHEKKLPLDERVLMERINDHRTNGGRTYCVIGSGAGGGVAARSIQELDPDACVILIEAGRVTANDDYPETVQKASSMLFMNAGSTATADQKFTFRQGRTVGGSTAVNNAIAVKPEGFWWDENLVSRWTAAGALLDWPRLSAAYDEVGRRINVRRLDAEVITNAAITVRDGLHDIGLGHDTAEVTANLERCVACGRCNLGCQYQAKCSTNTTFIPDFIRDGGLLLTGAKAEKLDIEITPDGKRHIRSVMLLGHDGTEVSLHADRFILAAGAYASTKLLWESGFTGYEPSVRTVGKRFTCNFGSPVIGLFDRDMHGWAGQQIGYITYVEKERIVVETAFAPPGVLGALAPQWGNAFMKLIENFSRIAVTAPTVASLSHGEIRRGNLFSSGYLIDWKMNDEDWRRLADGMKISARAMFRRGAMEVLTTRFDARPLTSEREIDEYFDGIGPAQYFKVESAHPQGGNVIHASPRLGVVDEGMKVHGIDNLWICDASVIPSAITLNLQYTVMALARYAAPGIVHGS